MLRGGMERFQPDGSVSGRRQPPSWEWLYGISYLARAVVHDVLHFDQLFFRPRELAAEQERAADEIRRALLAIAALGHEHGFRVVVVFHPDRVETATSKWSDSLAPLIADLGRSKELQVVDVLERFRRAGIHPEWNDPRFYWPKDGHHTPEGYALLGRSIAEGLATPP